MASSEVGALAAAALGARAPRNARQSALSCDAMRPAARHLLYRMEGYFYTANFFRLFVWNPLLAPWSLLGGEYNPRRAWCGARARGTGTNANTTDTICP